jgi:hypothetical protein
MNQTFLAIVVKIRAPKFTISKAVCGFTAAHEAADVLVVASV